MGKRARRRTSKKSVRFLSNLIVFMTFHWVSFFTDEEKVPEKFMLDRPFVFLLKYKCNIVLIGHVLNPEKP